MRQNLWILQLLSTCCPVMCSSAALSGNYLLFPQGLRRLQIHSTRAAIDHHAVMGTRVVCADLLIPDIGSDLGRIAQKRITKATTTRLHMGHQVAALQRHCNFPPQFLRFPVPRQQVLRQARWQAALKTVGCKLQAVGAQLQQRIIGQHPVRTLDAEAAAIASGAAAVGDQRFCRNKRNRQSNACLISAKVQSTAPCARSSNGSTTR